ncbi:hypothetical protein AO398_10605 [Methylobacterium sp. GXS13]|nr:hypothetical protein AO398_10605 [Methylobacterium sp. GXS13]
MLGGVGLQIVRDWVVAFNAYSLDVLISGKAPGACSRPNAEQRKLVCALVEMGQMRTVRGVMRCRLADLAEMLFEGHWLSVARTRPVRAALCDGRVGLTS